MMVASLPAAGRPPQNPQEALAQQRQAPQQDHQAGQQQTAFREAPARFDDAAKTEWEKTPEAVRGSIHRSIRELEQGHQKYKADAEAFGELRDFDALAKRQGVSLKEALTPLLRHGDLAEAGPDQRSGAHRRKPALPAADGPAADASGHRRACDGAEARRAQRAPVVRSFRRYAREVSAAHAISLAA